jgi:hypothetical protein
MWWWWFFTCIHNCVSIFLFITKNAGNPKMSFNRQLYIFFGKIISFTCDLHLKLEILNSLNLVFLSNGLKNESFALQPFPSKFQEFKTFVWFGFSSNSPNECVLSQKGTCFVVQNIWNQLYDLKHSFWLLF